MVVDVDDAIDVTIERTMVLAVLGMVVGRVNNAHALGQLMGLTLTSHS